MVEFTKTAKGIAVIALLIALAANGSGVITNGITSQNNCEDIQRTWTYIREVTRFDEKEFNKTLIDLGIDPTSEKAEHLRRRSEEAALKIQKQFAAENCKFPILWGNSF